MTEIDRNMVVEAAAGTGKTSILAGRVAMLLADGCPPGAIAVMTFGEAAAGELASRVRVMVERLLGGGEPPPELLPAVRHGLDPGQKAALSIAAASLDELTAVTIHGFCHSIIRANAVSAGVDPGATVMDEHQAETLFDRVLDRWLERRLAAPADGDPIAIFALDGPANALRIIRRLAVLRRDNPEARTLRLAPDHRPDQAFGEAVTSFSGWYKAGPAERGTAEILHQLRTLAAFYDDALGLPPTFAGSWRLSNPPRQAIMRPDSPELRPCAPEPWAWKAVVDGPAAADLAEAGKAHFGRCMQAFADILATVNAALLGGLSEAVDELLDEYARAKADAAALDFDDLSNRAARLIRNNPDGRRAAALRYRHLLVDEFQDTDPAQAAVILGVARGDGASIRPGSFFAVGDPKQSIYRFRGADVTSYARVKDDLVLADPDCVVQLTANFRSDPCILRHVNRCFSAPLDGPGQPGHVPLAATIPALTNGAASVVRLGVLAGRGGGADAQHDAEAAAVAEACARLVGNMRVRRSGGVTSPLRAGDVALLSMTHNDLWRYERALSRVGLAVAPQAGKALMRRQETQDFLALARTLADPADTLALGALLRGPLVGLSDAELLAATAALPPSIDGVPGRLSLWTDPDGLDNPILRGVLVALRDLRGAASTMSPATLLATAVERLRVRVAVALRWTERDGRAQANIDALIRRARPFAVRGLSAFAADLQARWEDGDDVHEGRCDERGDAVAIVTVHAAKGLEWPVVITINGGTRQKQPSGLLHRRSDDTLHWKFQDFASVGHAAAREEEVVAERLQRERLWYVACTRARDLLVLPHLPNAHGSAWCRVVDLAHRELPPLEVDAFPMHSPPPRTDGGNVQTSELFALQATALARSSPAITWRTPSDDDGDRQPSAMAGPVAVEQGDIETMEPVGAGRIRGLVIHKLIEEILTGEVEFGEIALGGRASTLIGQLDPELSNGERLPNAAECAETAGAALLIPEIAALRPCLVSELVIQAPSGDCELIAGRVDAAAIEYGRVSVVVDWKSDVNPSESDRRAHAGQMAQYLTATDAPLGAIVYVTRREVTWLRRG